MRVKNNIYNILNDYLNNRKAEGFMKNLTIVVETKNNKEYIFIYDFDKKKRVGITKIFDAMAEDYMLTTRLYIWQLDELKNFLPSRYKKLIDTDIF